VKLWVKDREAGRVIGRGGETVREIMDRTGADIRVQKSGDMKAGSTQREVMIFGLNEQQEQALELILTEVTWARGPDGMLKIPIEDEVHRREERRRRRQHQKERKADQNEERDIIHDDDEHSRRAPPEANSGSWVCSTCGGDHKSKECPHVNGPMGVGMQIGMQMGMQAMGMQALQMGMQMGAVMGPPLVPMLPMPGLPGMFPSSCPRSSSESSGSSSSRGCGSVESCASSVGAASSRVCRDDGAEYSDRFGSHNIPSAPALEEA